MRRLIAGAGELGIELTSEQVGKFELYYETLMEWNQRMNLTSIIDHEEVQAKHFVDSLTLCRGTKALVAGADLRLVDIGSGAGFPGLALKIAFPEIKLMLIEATGKKAGFLHHLIELLGFEDVIVANSRAETVAHQNEYREQFDVAVCRAVGPLAVTVELALPFCRRGGVYIAQKKGQIEDEIQRARSAMEILGGELERVERLSLATLGEERLLVVIAKSGVTPPAYPRRPGIPAKRPL